MHKKQIKQELIEDITESTNENKTSSSENIVKIEHNQQFKIALQGVLDDYAQAFKKLAE